MSAEEYNKKLEEIHTLLLAIGMPHILMIFPNDVDEEGNDIIKTHLYYKADIVVLDVAADNLAELEDKMLAEANPTLMVDLPDIEVSVDVTEALTNLN